MIGLLIGSHLLQIILAGPQPALLAGSSDPTAEREVGGAKDQRRAVRLLDRGGVFLPQLHDGRVRGGGGLNIAVRVRPS